MTSMGLVGCLSVWTGSRHCCGLDHCGCRCFTAAEGLRQMLLHLCLLLVAHLSAQLCKHHCFFLNRQSRLLFGLS